VEFPSIRPVLFLTNDNMSDAVSKQSELISKYYRLSWGHCADATARLLKKENIENRCLETGLSYPASRTVGDVAAFPSQTQKLRFPVIVKPSKPLSTFKTLIVPKADDHLTILSPHASSVPFIVQEFIPGDDRKISFCALFLDRGEVVCNFEGRKIQSRPMGHTTIAIPFSDPELLAYTKRFFAGLGLSGPVSLEVKRDKDGTMWVIEPTVGRTDFWVSLCIVAGVNLPLIEYRNQIGLEVLPAHKTVSRRVVWLNGERDPLGLFRLAYLAPSRLWRHRISGVFADLRDPLPWVVQTSGACRRGIFSIPRRTIRLLGLRQLLGKSR
jgi:D-aspartate ligase